jgi:hypothetical protein
MDLLLLRRGKGVFPRPSSPVGELDTLLKATACLDA